MLLQNKNHNNLNKAIMGQCLFCGKETPDGSNYCSSECHINAAKDCGGEEIRPNGLPITCIKANGDMLEHPDADHPDYKFPVDVEFCGTQAQKEEMFSLHSPGGEVIIDEKFMSMMCHQNHALIYSDGNIAITIYEARYYMWFLKRGTFDGGPHWDTERKMWKLSEESRLKILSKYKRDRNV